MGQNHVTGKGARIGQRLLSCCGLQQFFYVEETMAGDGCRGTYFNGVIEDSEDLEALGVGDE